MFRHCVMMKFSDDSTPDQHVAARDALRALPETIPSIRSYSVGLDAGLKEGNFSMVVVAEFDDAAGFQGYLDHPDHVAAVKDHLVAIISGRAAVQYDAAV